MLRSVESREGGTAAVDLPRRRSKDRSSRRDAPSPTPIPTPSPWSFLTGETQGVEAIPFPARILPSEDGPVVLVIVGVLALVVLPFLLHKARQEWRS
ncbi:MAG TPA: hypothetical protein VFQ40_08275 [Actinomycetota bacterium]|nr:hypothetical protein [Actinomycetota bacterium]